MLFKMKFILSRDTLSKRYRSTFIISRGFNFIFIKAFFNMAGVEFNIFHEVTTCKKKQVHKKSTR